MSKRPSVLVCRVGRLDWYHSKLDRGRNPIGGGRFNERDRGAECDNFFAHHGVVEGFVQAGERFNLRRVNREGEPHADLVLFFTVQPGGGEWLVGWYRDAELLDGYEDRTHGDGPHNLRARAANAVLLPFHLRTRIAAPARGAGGIGQSNVRYLLRPDGKDDSKPWRAAIDFALGYRGENLVVLGRTPKGRARALLDADDDTYIEGKPVLRWHYARERSSAAAARKREDARRRGLGCEVCRDALKRYGAAAERALEVHHRLPLGQLKNGRTASTRLRDLAIVCANCHRALHATGLSVEALARTLR